MQFKLTPAEDAELRWLVDTGVTSALTPEEQRRLAALRMRDRRQDVRQVGSDAIVVVPPLLGALTGDQGRAYRLSRRLVDLVIATGGVQVILLLATHDQPSFDQLVEVLPEEVRPKARELLEAIQADIDVTTRV